MMIMIMGMRMITLMIALAISSSNWLQANSYVYVSKNISVKTKRRTKVVVRHVVWYESCKSRDRIFKLRYYRAVAEAAIYLKRFLSM